jgi:uncharacterized membrane protein YdfJ with MMPL/SSD domain
LPGAHSRHLRGIGAFAVKFRWVVIAARLIAAVAVPKFPPSLASVTQGSNSAFLPASCPADLAGQLGLLGTAAITVYWQHGVLEAPILPLVT